MNQEKEKKNIWSVVLKVIIAVASGAWYLIRFY